MIDVHATKMVPVQALKVAPYNPRRISKYTMEALKQSIREHGFVEPVIAQASSMMIIGGHQRVEALRALYRETGEKLPKIPVVLLDVDDRKAKLLNVALNKVTGEFDETLLVELFSSVDALTDSDVLATGFTRQEIDAMLITPPETDDGATGFASSVTLSIRFDTVEERDAAQALLNERAQRTGKKPAVLLRELLQPTT